MELKNIIAAIVAVLVAIIGTAIFVADQNNGEVVKLQTKIKNLESDLAAMNTEVSAEGEAKDQINEAAKLGFTEQPGWQLQKIIANGGDGSVFYQVHATTKKDGESLSTVGPLGFSWQSTSDDALKAAAERRGTLKK